jgi:hypothetical protein
MVLKFVGLSFAWQFFSNLHFLKTFFKFHSFFATAPPKFALKILFYFKKLVLSLILVPSTLGVCESFFLVWGFGGLTMASEFVPEALA